MNGAKKLPKILVIVGPTASGKTALSIKLAKKFVGEIISADSRQIYCGMDIGTAKPTQDASDKRQATRKSKSLSRVYCFLSQGIPHHLINIKNPNEDYTAAEYKKDAIAEIGKILQKKNPFGAARGKLPILAGGTGLYVKVITDNLEIPEVKADERLRKKFEKEIAKRGIAPLFEKLIKLDPEAAYVVDPKNPRRIIRALEVAIKTGKTFSELRKKGKPLFEILEIGINLPKEKLKERINRRAEEMIKQGLVKEVKNLIGKYGKNPKAFDAIGYKEIIDYLDKKITLAEAVGLIKKNTWRYAKRQMTWFKRDERIRWVKNEAEAARFVNDLFHRRKE